MNSNQFTLLLNQHTSALTAFAMKFTKNIDDAQDLLQDTMLKAFRYYNKYEEGTNLKAWLFIIMKNTFINNYRKNAKAKALTSQEEEISSANLLKSSTKNQSESTFAMNDIQKALNQIPKVYSVAFVRYVEGYKYHEIAAELNIPLGTVKTHIHQARTLLKKQLKMYKESIN